MRSVASVRLVRKKLVWTMSEPIRFALARLPYDRSLCVIPAPENNAPVKFVWLNDTALASECEKFEPVKSASLR